MTHAECQDLLVDLACGELSPRAARAAERHLAACADCRAALSQLRATRRTMGALPPEPAPERGEALLLAAAREEVARRRRERPASILPSWLWGAAVGAVSIVAVGAISYRLYGLRPRPAPAGEELLGRGSLPEPPPSAASAAPATPVSPTTPGPAAKADGAAAGLPAPALRQAQPPSVSERVAGAPAPPAAPVPAAPPQERLAVRAEAENARVADEGRVEQRLADSAPPPPAAAAPEAAPPRAAPSGDAAEPGRPGAAQAPPARALAAPSAPAARRRSAEAPAPAPSEGAPSALASADAPTRPAAIARYEALSRAGVLRSTSRAFPGCPGERQRRIDRDASGRVVRLATEGDAGTVEQFYAEDGALAAVRVTGAGAGAATVLDLSGASVAAARAHGSAPAGLVGRAEDVRDDDPPRCR
jgi:hypothetical protein